MVILFRRYSTIIILAVAILIVTLLVLNFKREEVWKLLGKIKSPTFRNLFPFLGVIIFIGSLSTLFLLYPYERSVEWITLKFGLLCFLLGLSFSVFNLLPWLSNRKNVFGIFVVIAIIILGLSFIYPAISTLIDAAIGIRTVETAIGHRHFAFLLIPIIIASTIAVFFIKRDFLSNRSSRSKTIIPIFALLILVLSAGGLYNLYWPIGGWYPEWCNQPEIVTANWVSDNSLIPSTIITDQRLTKLIQGTYPMGSERYTFVFLNPLVLDFIENGTLSNETARSPHYIFTSALAEEFSIIEFLYPPIQFNYSSVLDESIFASKIFSTHGSNVYWVN
jgi:hypothetical protein